MAKRSEDRAPRFDALALADADDVATALRDLTAGTTARVRQGEREIAVQLADPIPLCHKLALRPLAAGDRVRKYGEVIGEATVAIPAGGHVHVHNLASLRARRQRSDSP
jgi:altronate dehydratase small subunit